jgi:hypothetical protein
MAAMAIMMVGHVASAWRTIFMYGAASWRPTRNWSSPRIAQREVACSERASNVPDAAPGFHASLRCGILSFVKQPGKKKAHNGLFALLGSDRCFSSEKPFLVLSQQR